MDDVPLQKLKGKWKKGKCKVSQTEKFSVKH